MASAEYADLAYRDPHSPCNQRAGGSGGGGDVHPDAGGLPGGADNPDNLPVNDAKIAKQQLGFKAPAGEVYLAVENPRGELGFHIISDGKGPKPVRCKVRSPAYCNISILDHMSKGALVADLVAIIGSIDIVMGEVDR